MRNYKIIFISIILETFMAFAGCREDVHSTRGAYYWNPAVKLEESDRNRLKELGTTNFYIKFFDVHWNETQQRPLPLAQVKFDNASLLWIRGSGMEVVPVICIDNDCLEKILPERVNALGERINYLLKQLLSQNSLIEIKEIRFDCDWSPATRDKYFSLLEYLKMLPFFQEKKLSATLRAPQCDTARMGIPPVQNVVWGAYGSLADSLNPNLPASLADYPLPVDVAIGIEPEKLLIRKESLASVLHLFPDSALERQSVFTRNGSYYEVMKDTLVKEFYVKRGDRIYLPVYKTREQILNTCDSLGKLLKKESRDIALFPMDSLAASPFKKEKPDSIYRILEGK